MFNTMLVPLDGSDLAECTLEEAKNIARGCNAAELILFRVVEPFSAEAVAALAEAGDNVLGKIESERRQEAKDYLSRVSAGLKAEGITCRAVLADGRAADEILDYAAQNHVDLIVMSTHGRSGLSRWLSGSVAEKVSRHSAIPVLLVTPAGCRNIPRSAH